MTPCIADAQDEAKSKCAAPGNYCIPGALCGNGAIDACSYCVFGIQTGADEFCDGADLGAHSCATLGYSGGQLACGADCTPDVTDCAVCAATGGVLDACRNPGLDVASDSPIAVATSSSEVALAYVSASQADGGNGIALARFSTDLVAIGSPSLVLAGDAVALDVAPLPSGWVLAASHPDGSVTVHALDSAGAPTGAPTKISGATDPHFAVRAGAGPLLAWSTGAAVVASVLPADASAVPAPTTLLSGAATPTSAAFVGDGFLVAVQVSSNVVVGRVEPDGSMTHPLAFPLAATPLLGAPKPQLAFDGSAAMLVYTSDQLPYFARLDTLGQLVIGPTQLTPPNDRSGTTPVAVAGTTPLALVPDHATFANPDHASAFMVDSIDAQTGATTASAQIAADPLLAGSWRIVGSGSSAVAAWLGGGCPARIFLAKLVP